MSSIFPDVLNAQRGADTRSNAFVATAAGQIRIVTTSPSGIQPQIIKNGVASGTNVSYLANDAIAVQARASQNASDPHQVVIEFNGATELWAVVTAADRDAYVEPKMISRSDVESFINSDGATYFPQASANRLRVLPDIGQPSTNSVSLAQAVSSSVGVTNALNPVVSFHDKRIHLCDKTTGQVMRTLTVEGTPYSAAFVARNPRAASKIYDLWVTLTDLNAVAVYDASGANVATFPVGDDPYQLAVSPDGESVYVGCAASNEVERFIYDGDTFVQDTIAVEARPIHVAATNAACFAACAGSSVVAQITKAGAVLNVEVGEGPHGIAVLGNAVYVAVLTEATVKKIVAGSVDALIEVDEAPTSLTVIGSSLAVICNAEASVMKITNDAVVARSEFGEWPYSVHIGNSRVFVAEQWQGAPNSYMYELDRDPHPFTFDNPTTIKRDGSQYVTNEFEVKGINIGTYASVSPVSGATIMRNGAPAGSRVLVEAGDRLAVRFAAQTEPEEEVRARLFVGQMNAEFDSVTTALDIAPDEFDFTPVFNADLATAYTSNEITISGLEDGLVVNLLLDRGRLFLNGVEQTSITAEVKNGDKVYIIANSSGEESTPVFCKLTVSTYEAVWSIMTKYVEVPTNYMEAQYSGRTMFQLVNFGAVEDVVDRTKDKIVRVNKTTFAKIAEFPLTPSGNQGPGDLTDNPLLYAFDPTRKAIDLVDSVNGVVNTTHIFPTIPYAIAAAPAVARTMVPTNQWVTALNQNSIFQFNGNRTIPIPSGAEPMGIGCSNYNQLFVAGSNGFLYAYEYDEDTDRFTFSSLIGVPNGGRLQDILFDDTQMFVNDITTNRIHVLRSGFYIRSIDTGLMPYCIAQSGTMVYSANFGAASVTAAPKDPAAGQPFTVNLPHGASLPNCMAYDATNGYLYVGSSVAGKVYVLRATTLELIRVLDVGPVFGLQIIGNELVVMNRWGNLFDAKNIGLPRSGPNSLVFAPIAVTDVDTHVETPVHTITTRMPRVEKLWIEPYSNVDVMLNGSRSTSTVDVTTGNSIALRTISSAKYLKDRRVRAFSYNYVGELVISTPADTFPEFILFATQQNIVVNDRVHSESKTVRGLGDNVSIKAIPTYNRTDVVTANVQLFINGKQYVEGAQESDTVTGSNLVKNDDEIALAFDVIRTPWNGNKAIVSLSNELGFKFAEFTATTGYLDNAIRPPYKDDDTDAMSAIEYTKEDDREADVDRDVDEVMHDHKESFDGPDTYTAFTAKYERDTEAEQASDTQRAITHIDRDAYVSSRTRLERDEMEYVRPENHWPYEIYNVLEWVGTVRNFCLADSEMPNEAEMGQPFSQRYVEPEWLSRERSQRGTRTQQFEDRYRTRMFSGVMDWLKIGKRYSEFATEWRRSDRSFQDVMTESLVGQKFSYSVDVGYLRAQATGSMTYNSGSLGVDHRSRYIYGTDFVDRAKRGRYEVQTSGIAVSRTAVFQTQNDGWWIAVHNSSYWAGVQYTGRVRADAKSVATGAITAHKAKMMQRATVQYVSRARAHFDEFTYTAAGIRAFNTEADAIAAGEAQLHPVVFAHKLFDSFYMWEIPALVERVDCARTALQARYVKGYVQGG